jgi:hypothetical protein
MTRLNGPQDALNVSAKTNVSFLRDGIFKKCSYVEKMSENFNILEIEYFRKGPSDLAETFRAF